MSIVQDQLQAAGLWKHVITSTENEDGIDGLMELYAFHVLRSDPRFTEGPLGTLHPEIGEPRSDFRGDSGAFGKRSLQVVINQETGRFHADTDRYNAYGGALPFSLHGLLEVLPGCFRRKPSKDPADV